MGSVNGELKVEQVAWEGKTSFHPAGPGINRVCVIGRNWDTPGALIPGQQVDPNSIIGKEPKGLDEPGGDQFTYSTEPLS